MTEHAALVEADLQVDWLRDIRRRGHAPKLNKVSRLARVLDMPTSYFMGVVVSRTPRDNGPPEDGSDLVKRFRAARWACWEDKERARQRLGISLEELKAIETGAVEIDEALLIRFAGVTGVPLTWFQTGTMAGLPGPIAARVGLFDPSLVPDAPEEERSQTERQQAVGREIHA